ncbi:MAG: hypothetical protein OHK0012_15890 [Synechococcales cyanobacterium]
MVIRCIFVGWLLVCSLLWGSRDPAWSAPLTPAEQAMAQQAWVYFQNNTNRTGLANSVVGYPSATLWEQGNLAVAIVAAQELGLIDQADRERRLDQILTGLENLPLFEDALPNKAYNTETGVKTDYGNNPMPRGIGFSGLDLGRLINALFVVKTTLPQYQGRIEQLLGRWQLDRLYQQGDLYGAVVLPDGRTLPVQEGRHGYLEYAARSGLLLNRAMPKALDPPVETIEVYGIPIKNDRRRFQEFNAVAYTVTEAPALEIIEHGVAGRPAVWDEFCRIYAAQRNRWQATGRWTAATEDHITGRLYSDTPFLYNTVIADGIPWAVVTEDGRRFDQRRTVSTKAAVLMTVLQPQDDPDRYGDKLFGVVQPLFNEGGYWAGQFEQVNEPNDILTNNTNGILLEALWAKQRGTALISNEPFPTTCGALVQTTSASPSAPAPKSSGPSPQLGLSPVDRLSPGGIAPLHQFAQTARCEVVQTTPQGPLALSSLPALANGPQPSRCASVNLAEPQRRYAQVAWNYFEHYRDPQTGLVPSRSDLGATTLWGIGDTVAALITAERLGLITAEGFDQRLRQVLGTVRVLPTVEGLPHMAYAITTGQPTNEGGVPGLPNEWDALGLARLWVALAQVQHCHPEYAPEIEQQLVQWRYYAMTHAQSLYSGRLGQKPQLECSIYSHYAIPGANLWGWKRQEPTYQRVTVAGQSLAVGCDGVLTSDSLLYRQLELGGIPGADTLPGLKAHWQAQTSPSGAATVALAQPPYQVRNTLWARGQTHAVYGLDSQPHPELASVGTGAAFAWAAVLPDNPDARTLQQTAIERTLTDPTLGFEDGYVLATGIPAGVRTSQGNFLVLAALHYAKQGSLITDFQPTPLWTNRGWWLGG